MNEGASPRAEREWSVGRGSEKRPGGGLGETKQTRAWYGRGQGEDPTPTGTGPRAGYRTAARRMKSRTRAERGRQEIPGGPALLKTREVAMYGHESRRGDVVR